MTTQPAWVWNAEQQQAITNGVTGKSFCLIGPAGSGKTSTLKGTIKAMLESNSIPILAMSTNTLFAGTPGIVLVSYTRRAVRNIAKQMTNDMRGHCHTIHKLLEYAPEYYIESGPDGEQINKMRFAPCRNRMNPLPRTLTKIIIDESSMVDVELFAKLLAALPDPSAVQFIFLGDLNQLPPVYGESILGRNLLELPVVELTQIYRQALESPIIALATAIRTNKFADFNKEATTLWGADRLFDAKNIQEKITFHQPGRGKITIIPWKRKFDAEIALKAVKDRIPEWITSGFYDPAEDLMLCPWNKSFGTDELNIIIADTLGQNRKAMVWEVIAGYNRMYLAIGDKLLVDKQECWITDIYKNPRYVGKHTLAPSVNMTRKGKARIGTNLETLIPDDDDIDAMMEALVAEDVEDRVAESSHIIKVRMIDTDEEVLISKAATLNSSSFAYAITVHKAQGSECRKVFFITSHCHAQMLGRELVYTAITRAAEELIILMSPLMLASAASKPRIKGDTLAAKLEWFTQRAKERMETE